MANFARLVDDTNARRLSLFLNFNLLDGIPKFDGFYSSDLKEFQDVFKHVYFRTNEAPRLKDFLGISHVSNATNVVDWTTRDSFLPLVTGGQAAVFKESTDTLTAILGPGFDPLRQVYLPPAEDDAVRSAEAASCQVKVTEFTSRRLVLDLEADRATMVVIAQTFYPCWHAYMDGRRTALQRANYAFQAVAVSPGKHRLVVLYEDSLFLWGAAVSAFSLMACVAGWFWWRRPQVPSTK